MTNNNFERDPSNVDALSDQIEAYADAAEFVKLLEASSLGTPEARTARAIGLTAILGTETGLSQPVAVTMGLDPAAASTGSDLARFLGEHFDELDEEEVADLWFVASMISEDKLSKARREAMEDTGPIDTHHVETDLASDIEEEVAVASRGVEFEIADSGATAPLGTARGEWPTDEDLRQVTVAELIARIPQPRKSVRTGPPGSAASSRRPHRGDRGRHRATTTETDVFSTSGTQPPDPAKGIDRKFQMTTSLLAGETCSATRMRGQLGAAILCVAVALGIGYGVLASQSQAPPPAANIATVATIGSSDPIRETTPDDLFDANMPSPEQVYLSSIFDPGSDTIKPDAVWSLRKIAMHARDNKKSVTVQVIASGVDQRDWKSPNLTTRRTESIRDLLGTVLDLTQGAVDVRSVDRSAIIETVKSAKAARVDHLLPANSEYYDGGSVIVTIL